MKTRAVATALAALAMSGFLCAGRARADVVTYIYPALPGPVTNCAWFDDNLNDRSINALIRQTDLIYNRAPLHAGDPVVMTGSATTARGEALAEFTRHGRSLCSDAAAFSLSASH